MHFLLTTSSHSKAGGAVNPAPALSSDGNVVYAGSDDNRLYAINADTGVKLWVRSYRSC